MSGNFLIFGSGYFLNVYIFFNLLRFFWDLLKAFWGSFFILFYFFIFIFIYGFLISFQLLHIWRLGGLLIRNKYCMRGLERLKFLALKLIMLDWIFRILNNH